MTERGSRWLLAALCLLTVGSWIGCRQIFPQRTEGEKLYRQRCAECHGLRGSGNTPRFMGDPAADLLDESWEHGRDDGSMIRVIRRGVPARMPANDDLTKEQAQAIVDHVRSLRREYGTGN